jgi:tetratricopeptide (TPR) repeat protein
VSDFAAALAHAQRGDLAAAENILRALIARNRSDPNALHLLANVLHARGQTQPALHHFEEARALAPHDPAIAFNHAVALAAAQRHEEAVSAFADALLRNPNDVEALRGQAASLARLGRHAEALSASERALSFKSNDIGAHFIRAAALIALDRSCAALEALDRLLQLAPNHTAARAHRATALANLARFDEALAEIDAVIAREPQRLDHHKRRAHVLSMSNRRDEARDAYGPILAQMPDDKEARYGRADALLALGDLKQGWADYEARAPMLHGQPSSAPLWTGAEPLDGKTILVQAEQGFGDLFQFCRFLPELKRRGARVVLQERPQTFALLQSLGAVDQFVSTKEPAPPADYRIPTNSLMHALGVTLESIPADIPYLRAAPECVEAWRQRLEAAGVSPAGRKRIGLCWSGTIGSPFQRSRNLDRASLERLFSVDAELVSLQYDPTSEAIALMAQDKVRDFSADTRDFAELAALIANLDLIISVDTNVAHLAGALGKPLFVLLPHTADWRWLMHREDTPWYPQARLFRQPRHGDWASVIDRVLASVQ